ncbi:hypothetical protein BDF20DRAFT_481793 [Mycotypha africana]|uniref:uncharacterized protein n=1 Tax=Mycotypha africana TaxID=64632 RepID=UPI002300CF56|nr:uncharacterized protein BDF20DRAFT_481793 [Mycotypha africana]KAI8979137.1 hypothetical protein BDF20DRAFT_481793 [Mycotypha africana]
MTIRLSKRCHISCLSPEVFLSIFSWVSKADLQRCIYVCKAWYRTAGQIYFQHLSVADGKQIIKLFQYLIVSPMPETASMIRSLHITNDQYQSSFRSFSIADEHLRYLLEYCPNIHELGFDSNSPYWLYLYNIPNKPNILKPKKLISLGRRRDFTDRYFYKVAAFYASSITELEIHQACDPAIRVDYGGLFGYLSMFSNLKYLYIRDGSTKHIVYFHDLLEVTRNLEKLNFDIGHPFFPENDEINLLQLKQLSIYPSLRSLSIRLDHQLLPERLIYVIDRFPNLVQFILRLHCNQLHNDGTNRIIPDFPFEHPAFRNKLTTFIRRLKHTLLHFESMEVSYHVIAPLLGCYLLSDIHTRTSISASFCINKGTDQTIIDVDRTNTMNEKQKYSDITTKFMLSQRYDRQDFLGRYQLAHLSYLSFFGCQVVNLDITLSTEIVALNADKATNVESLLQLCPLLKTLRINIESSRPIIAILQTTKHSLSATQPPYERIGTDDTEKQNEAEKRQNDHLKCLTTLSLSGILSSVRSLEEIAMANPEIKELHLLNCAFLKVQKASFVLKVNLRSLSIYRFTFDAFSCFHYIKSLSSRNVCVVIEQNMRIHAGDNIEDFFMSIPTVCHYYLLQYEESLFKKCRFKQITADQYKGYKATEGLYTIWFAFKSLKVMKLQVGKSVQSTETIVFSDLDLVYDSANDCTLALQMEKLSLYN